MTSCGKIQARRLHTRRMMRFPRIALGSAAALLVACGGGVEVTPGGGASASATSSSSGGAASTGSGSAGSGSITGSSTGPDQILGQLLVVTEAFNGQLLETFSADLQPLPKTTTSAACAGATASVGACCVFPPIRPVPTLPPGTGTGAANIGTSAGVLALLDATSSANIATFDFGSGGYAGLPASYYTSRWQPGDLLKVSATGDQIGAFTASAPALSPPVLQLPASIVTTADLRITWQPDPNADTMRIQIIDSNAGSVVVACSAPDSDGAVTVDASLFAAFKPGDSCQAGADRETVRYAQTSTGRVALRSFGYSASVGASVK